MPLFQNGARLKQCESVAFDTIRTLKIGIYAVKPGEKTHKPGEKWTKLHSKRVSNKLPNCFALRELKLFHVKQFDGASDSRRG
jgi:hypothetical protein